MGKTVNGNIVAANAFFSTGQDVISIEELQRYVGTVRERTNNKTKYFVGVFDATIFMTMYDFIFEYDINHTNIIVPRETKHILNGYFRDRLDEDFIKILDEVGDQVMGRKTKTKIQTTGKNPQKVKRRSSHAISNNRTSRSR